MAAKKLTDEKIKNGIGILVENQAANPREAKRYINFYVKVPELKNKKLNWETGTLTFTENEVYAFFTKLFEKCFLNEVPSLGLDMGEAMECWFSGGFKYFVRFSYNGIERTLLLPQGIIKKGIKRNQANPEDSTKPSLITRLFS